MGFNLQRIAQEEAAAYLPPIIPQHTFSIWAELALTGRTAGRSADGGVVSRILFIVL